MIPISNDNNQGAKDTKQSTQPLKTDQQILEELRQSSSGGGERRRGVGLTAFVILLAIVIAVFTALNNRAEDQSDDTSNATVTAQNDEDNDATQEDSEDADTQEAEDETSSEDVTALPEGPVVDADGTVDGEAIGELPNDDSSRTESSFTELAQVGEGVTHLARRALHGYLSEQEISDLGREQKVYVEDYLAKNSTPVYLAIGEGRTFDVTLIDEAITNARALTDAEIQNLTYYANMVPGL